MKTFKNISILVLLVLLSSCKERKTTRQIFEENIDKYVEAFAAPIIAKGADTLLARGFGRCVIEKMYALDSTVFAKEFDGKNPEQQVSLEDLHKKHYNLLSEECSVWIEQIKQGRDQKQAIRSDAGNNPV